VCVCVLFKVVQETEDSEIKKGDLVGLKKNEHVSAMSHLLECLTLVL
jgi:hypothetical protein